MYNWLFSYVYEYLFRVCSHHFPLKNSGPQALPVQVSGSVSALPPLLLAPSALPRRCGSRHNGCSSETCPELFQTRVFRAHKKVTNMAIGNSTIWRCIFPIQNGDFPLPCEFSEVYPCQCFQVDSFLNHCTVNATSDGGSRIQKFHYGHIWSNGQLKSTTDSYKDLRLPKVFQKRKTGCETFALQKKLLSKKDALKKCLGLSEDWCADHSPMPPIYTHPKSNMDLENHPSEKETHLPSTLVFGNSC